MCILNIVDFLPHDGYATVLQYIDATTKVVGMGPNLALFLSALGGALDGDILNWSVGSTPSLAQGGPTGVLGNGLTGMLSLPSHGCDLRLQSPFSTQHHVGYLLTTA